MVKRKKRRQQNRAGKIWIMGIVAIFLVVMSIQIVRLYEKNQSCLAKETNLKTQLEEEKERSDEIKEYEEYTKSEDFVEDNATNKLNLVYDNWILFKKK